MADPRDYRVFFDSNIGSMEHGYPLWFDLSKRELDAIGHALRDGLEIVMRATLRWGTEPFDQTAGCWWADPVPDTIRLLDNSD